MRLTRVIAALLLPIVLFSCAAVSAQTHDLAQTPALEPAFVKTRSERDADMRTNNYEVYGRYTTENFWVIMPDGSVQTKQDRMAAMKKNQSPTGGQGPEQLSAPRDEMIDAYGSTIVVSWISAIQGRDARFSETWVKQNGGWKCAAAHVSMIQTKP